MDYEFGIVIVIKSTSKKILDITLLPIVVYTNSKWQYHF